MENKVNNAPNNISIIWKKVYEANGRIMSPIIQSDSIKAFREFNKLKKKITKIGPHMDSSVLDIFNL